jgi:hypothetical protein
LAVSSGQELRAAGLSFTLHRAIERYPSGLCRLAGLSFSDRAAADLPGYLQLKQITAGVNSVAKHTKFWLIAIFLLAFAVRFVDLGTHFTHYDDVFPAVDILKAQEPDFRQKLLSALYDQTKPSYYDKQKVFVRKIYENPKTRFIFESGVNLGKFLIVPLNSTSAPTQFAIIALLINKSMDYRAILFFSRLPSFIFGLLTIVLLYFSLRQKTNTAGLLSGLLIATLSLESIIYAKQATSYMIAAFSAAGLLLLFQQAQKNNFFQKHWLFSGLLAAFFTYTSYQLVFFWPAYYLANLRYKYLDKRETKFLIYSGFLNLLLCLPVLYYLFFVNTSGHGSYTIGKYGEFLFSPAGKNIFIYPLVFFLKNIFLVITNTLTPVTAHNLLFWFFGLFFCVALLYGLKKTYRQPEGLFIIINLVVYLGLVFGQKLALTPTRQALVYLPLFIYLIANGLPELKTKTLLPGLSIYLGIFLIFFPGFVRERQDKINEIELPRILEQYNPDLIIAYGYTRNLALFRTVKQNFNYFEQENIFLNQPIRYKTLAMVSTQYPLNRDWFQTSQTLWNQNNLKPIWQQDFSQYKIIYQKVSTSDVEIEPNNWNTNGSNNLFFYILALRQQ